MSTEKADKTETQSRDGYHEIIRVSLCVSVFYLTIIGAVLVSSYTSERNCLRGQELFENTTTQAPHYPDTTPTFAPEGVLRTWASEPVTGADIRGASVIAAAFCAWTKPLECRDRLVFPILEFWEFNTQEIPYFLEFNPNTWALKGQEEANSWNELNFKGRYWTGEGRTWTCDWWNSVSGEGMTSLGLRPCSEEWPLLCVCKT